MKKIVLIVFLIFVVGCEYTNPKDNTNENNSDINNVCLTEEELDFALFNYAVEIYTSKSYNQSQYSVSKGGYVISLKDLKEMYKKDISMFCNINTQAQCDVDKSEIFIDKENKYNNDYIEYPIIVSLECYY
jgi:hypothetical protein